MYRFFVVSVLTFLLIPLQYAQQSFYHLQEDIYFQRGMELLEKEKYSAAQKFFESAYESYSSSNTILRTQSQYYIAFCAVRLFNNDAEFLTLDFVAGNPESPLIDEAYFNLAGYFYIRKKWSKAIEYYLKADPDKLSKEQGAEYRFKLGYAYFTKNEYEKAKPQFYQITDVDTKYSAPAVYYYSHIHYEEKNYQTALNGFLRLTGDKTFGPIAPYYIVQIYYLQGRYKEIVDFATGMIKNVTEKRLAEVSRIIAEAYSQLGQYEESLPYYQTYLDSSDYVSKEDKYQAGYAYYKAGVYEQAIAIFGSISSTDSQLGQNSSYYLADCYLKANDKQKSRMAFQSASSMDYDPVIKQDALFNYALLTYELSNDPFNEAIRAFEEFIRLYPESKRIDEAYRYLIQSYLRARNYKLAIESLEKSDLQSDDLKKAYQRVAFYRGVELFNNLEYAQALRLFDKSLQYASFDQLLKARAIYWKGEVYYRTGEFDNALDSYSDFRNVSVSFTAEEFAKIDYNIGYAKFKQKDYQGAIESFRKFVADASSHLSKEKGDAYNRIGDCLFAGTDYYSAIDNYDRAINNARADVEYAFLQKGICLGLINRDDQKIATLKKLVLDYPKSNYIDHALYEMALSNVKLQNPSEAISILKNLTSSYPQSKLVPGAFVQLGLIHYNIDNNQEALKYYKETVTRFPGSQEAKDALFGLKNIYVDMNKVDEYFAFVNRLGNTVPAVSVDEQDSMSYISAEKLYMAGDCEASSKAFERYISSYPQGGFLLNANFYKGDCNYQKKEFDKAFASFNYVLTKPANLFTEQSLLGSARIGMDRKDYNKVIGYYQQIENDYATPGNIKEATIALMECYFALLNYNEALKCANEVLAISKISHETERQANYIAARSLQEAGRDALAIEKYKKIAIEVMSKEGAEAKFRLAELYFKRNEFKEAEKEILDFSEKTSPHDYWIARSFILWADIFVVKKDYFQAVQTLQSLIDYYENTDDDILKMAKDKKAEIIKLQEANEKPKEYKDVEVNIE
jgi:tetratricopeptide (TPR) repeat protein